MNERLFNRRTLLAIGAGAALSACAPQPQEHPALLVPSRLRPYLRENRSGVFNGGSVIFYGYNPDGETVLGQGILIEEHGGYSVGTIAHVIRGIQSVSSRVGIYVPGLKLFSKDSRELSNRKSESYQGDDIVTYQLSENAARVIRQIYVARRVVPIGFTGKLPTQGELIAIPDPLTQQYSQYIIAGSGKNNMIEITHQSGPPICKGRSGAPALLTTRDRNGNVLYSNHSYGLVVEASRGNQMDTVNSKVCSAAVLIQPHNQFGK